MFTRQLSHVFSWQENGTSDLSLRKCRSHGMQANSCISVLKTIGKDNSTSSFSPI